MRHFSFIVIICAFVLFVRPDAGIAETPKKTSKSKIPVAQSADQRYHDFGDGTILDTKSMLMWIKLDVWQTEGKWLNWHMANEFVQKLNNKKFCGYSDWRLPTPEEAQSLYEPNKVNEDKDGDKIFIDPLFPKGAGWATWTNDAKGDKAKVVSYKDIGEQTYQDKISGRDAFVRLVRKHTSK